MGPFGAPRPRDSRSRLLKSGPAPPPNVVVLRSCYIRGVRHEYNARRIGAASAQRSGDGNARPPPPIPDYRDPFLFLVTVLSGFAGTTQKGTILVAVVAPLVTAIVTTHGRGRARIVGIAALTGGAVIVTVTGVTFADVINQGRALFAPRVGTFVPLDRTPLKDFVRESTSPPVPTTSVATTTTRHVGPRHRRFRRKCSARSAGVRSRYRAWARPRWRLRASTYGPGRSFSSTIRASEHGNRASPAQSR